MPYQLLLRKHSDGLSLSELFARGKCLDFAQAPFALGKSDGLPEGAAFAFREEGGNVLVKNTGKQSAALSGEALAPSAERRIVHGDILSFAGNEVRFYRMHGRPGVSWSANAIGYLALCGIALALLVELGAIVRLPTLLKNRPGIHRQVELQALTTRIDQVRRRLKGKDLSQRAEKDTILAAYLQALQEEMEKRVAYLRRHGENLSAADRAEQLANLDRLDAILDRLESATTVTPPLPQVQIDGPVQHLIETR